MTTLRPTMQFKWFKSPLGKGVGVVNANERYELRQAFLCSDGTTKWMPVEIATEREQKSV